MASPDAVYFANLEFSYQLAFDAVLVAYVPVMLIYAWVVWWHSPNEFSSFQLTATNTIFWVLLPVPYYSIFFKPMPLLPFPAAVVSGLVTRTDMDLYLALTIGLLLAFNAILAITICLTMQFLSIKFPFFQRRIERRRGVSMVAACHVVGSSVVALILYLASARSISEDQLRMTIRESKPGLSSFVEVRRLVGFSATDGPGLLSTSVTVGIGLLTIQWIVMLVLTMRVVLQGFRHPKATRCTVANILAIRTMVPVLLISVPSIVVSCLYNFEASASTLACALIAVQMCSPIVSYMIKILGFKPYRIAVSGAFRRLSSRMSSVSNTSSEEISSDVERAGTQKLPSSQSSAAALK